MKLRDFKRNTFKVCRACYWSLPSKRRLRHLVALLERWARLDKEASPYNYQTQPFDLTLHYCADRMNPGRAKALLLMVKRDNLL